MIDLIFYFGSEIILVRVQGNSVQFGNSFYGPRLASIEGLKLNYTGVIKEFPDLKDNSNWRMEAIGRFKDRIKDYKSEKDVADYIIQDLKKFGYVPKFKQVAGFRREVIK